MGVLPIHNWSSESSFALLKENRILALCDCGWLQAQHGPQCQRPVSNFALSHTHKPIGREKFVRATRPGLLQLIKESLPMEHQMPLPFHEHEHLRGCGSRLGV